MVASTVQHASNTAAKLHQIVLLLVQGQVLVMLTLSRRAMFITINLVVILFVPIADKGTARTTQFAGYVAKNLAS